MVGRWLAIGVFGCGGPVREPAEPPDPGEPATPDCAPTELDGFAVEPLPGVTPGLRLSVETAEPGTVQVACTLTEAPPIWRQPLPFGGRWRFLDDADPGPGWTDPGFDDSAWRVGAAPLTTGDDGGTSLAGVGRTVWFRTTFEVADPARVRAIAGMSRREDGLAVWLNGREVFRDNLPEGPLVATTPASSDPEGIDALELVQLVLDPGDLVAGENTVAAEVHPADPGVSTDLAFDLRLATLVAEPPPDPPEVHVVSWEVPGEPPAILGVLADATYRCTATTACPGTPATAEVRTPLLQVPVPRVAVRPGSAPAWGHYTLFNGQRPCVREYENRFYLVDPEGRVRWVYETRIAEPSSVDLEVAWLGDGTFLWGGGDQPEGRPHIVALDGTTVHEAGYTGVEDDLYHHDVAWRDGEISGLVERPVSVGAFEAAGFGIVAYAPDRQTMTWAWDAQTAVDAGGLPPPEDRDPYHANAFTPVEDGDGAGFYVALLYANQVVRVDRATGAITWTLGRGGDFALVDETGAPLGDDAWFDGLHSIEVHGDRVLVYHNGWTRRQSEALELTLDTEARIATRSWSWTEPGWYERLWGDVDELPGGDLLVAMAHSWCNGGSPAHPGALLDVDRETGTVEWRLDFLDPDDTFYRAERLDGCALFANQRYCP